MDELYTITEQYHDKKDIYIYVVRLLQKVEKEDFDELRKLAKDQNGYYSSFRGVNGFVFKARVDAEIFGTYLEDYIELNVISEDDEDIEAPNEAEMGAEDNSIDTSDVIEHPSIGMPLHQALRYVIDAEGKDIIKEVRLVNILDDLKAYEEFPASKYILRALIADKYTAKFLSIGSWNSQSDQLKDRFVKTTGFIPINVDMICSSIAYALGWKEQIDLAHMQNQSALSSTPSQSSPQTPPKGSNPPNGKNKLPKAKSWNPNMNEDETERYFLDITEVNFSKESESKVSIENMTYFENVSGGISLSCELRRHFRKANCLSLYCAIYDRRNRLVEKEWSGYISNDTANPNPVLHGITFDAQNIGRIRLIIE